MASRGGNESYGESESVRWDESDWQDSKFPQAILEGLSEKVTSELAPE